MWHFACFFVTTITFCSSLSYHPSQSYELKFNTFPRCVPCNATPDGPLTGNGDLGLLIGANDNGYIGLFFGKNDFWGWPGPILWHGTFTHYSVGFVQLSLPKNTPPFLPNKFSAEQRLWDGRLHANISDNIGYILDVEAIVLSENNGIPSNVTVYCPKGVPSVVLDIALDTDNPFGLPTEYGVTQLDRVLITN